MITKIVKGILLVSVCLISPSCLEMETPASIHRRLVPEIAQELIENSGSERLNDLPNEAKVLLRNYKSEDLTFTANTAGVPGEANIQVFKIGRSEPMLTLGLNLHSSRTSYNVAHFSINTAEAVE